MKYSINITPAIGGFIVDVQLFFNPQEQNQAMFNGIIDAAKIIGDKVTNEMADIDSKNDENTESIMQQMKSMAGTYIFKKWSEVATLLDQIHQD